MKPYIGYEYKQATVPRDNLSQYLDGYESFGWQQDDRRPPSAGGRRVTIYLKRDRKIANKMELTRLQRHFEACMAQIEELQRAPAQTAALWALVVGLVGTAFLAGAVFAVTHQPPLYGWMTVLAVPGFAGWAAPCRLYPWVLRRQQARADPLLEAQWEEVDRLCAKGQALL